jgi:hypothetical protein
VDGIAIERTPSPGGQCIRFGDGRHQYSEIRGILGNFQGRRYGAPWVVHKEQRGLTANYFFKPAKHVFRNWRRIEKGLYANSRNEGT